MIFPGGAPPLLFSLLLLLPPIFAHPSGGGDQSAGSNKATTSAADRPQLLRQLSTDLDNSNVDVSKIQEIVPSEASNFYDRLTERDKLVLQKVLAKADSYSSTAEVLKDLRNGSSTLYDKAVQVVTSIRSTISKLSPPARSFLDESVDQLRGSLGDFSLANIKSQTQQVVQRFRRLSSETKLELREAFPMVAMVVDNPVFRTLASGLFGISADEEEEIGGKKEEKGGGGGKKDGDDEGRSGGGSGKDDAGGEGGRGRAVDGGGEVEDGVGERAQKKLIKH